MLLSEVSTFTAQSDLGKYCRTGQNEPQTSIQEHTFHYRRLVFNVVKDTLKRAFPLTRKLIGKKRWKKSVAHFFETHACQTPQVWRLPEEFAAFYQEAVFPFKRDFPMLKELLTYEWLEIEVFMMEDETIPEFVSPDQPHSGVFVPNPEIRIQALSYPIHKKEVTSLTEADAGQYFVSVHRDHYTKQVRFNDISYPFVEVLLHMHEQATDKQTMLELLAKYEPDPEKVIKAADDFLAFALKENLILGYQP